MYRYRYTWTLRSDANLEIEVHIHAEAAIGARRELSRFLADQPTPGWTVCALSRTREIVGSDEDAAAERGTAPSCFEARPQSALSGS